MKTIVEINSNNYASTGNIMHNIAKEARKEGFKVYTCCRKSRAGLRYKYEDQIYIGTWLDRVISERLSYVFGLNGYFNVINTWLFIRKLKKLKPDLIHIHSLCDNYLNIRMFFNYIADNNIPTIWTLHNVWPFTGRCARSLCDKWKQGCGNCPRLDLYPPSLFLDNTAMVWKERKKLYSRVKSLRIITPSKWLSDQVRISHLNSDHPVQVINNGIDLNIFKPTASSFRHDHNLDDKFIVLAVAYYWDAAKGLDVFKELAKRLPDNYRIVMVGTNEEIDRELCEKIISVHKTSNQEELVQIYSAADLFVNPTTDDNFPTVNMEALACGLPVLTYDTGGCSEIIDETSGCSVKPGDIDELEKKIIEISKFRPYKKEACVNRASHFDMSDKFKEYVKLYNKITG